MIRSAVIALAPIGFMLSASTGYSQAPSNEEATANSKMLNKHQHHDSISPEAVLNSYRKAIESLDGSAMADLFSQNSQIFENGKAEGSFANYLAHHLGPELDHVKSFSFTEPTVSVESFGDTAIAQENYGYVIVLADGRTINRIGVATSVLRKDASGWKIVQYHSSSRIPKKK